MIYRRIQTYEHHLQYTRRSSAVVQTVERDGRYLSSQQWSSKHFGPCLISLKINFWPMETMMLPSRSSYFSREHAYTDLKFYWFLYSQLPLHYCFCKVCCMKTSAFRKNHMAKRTKIALLLKKLPFFNWIILSNQLRGILSGRWHHKKHSHRWGCHCTLREV